MEKTEKPARGGETDNSKLVEILISLLGIIYSALLVFFAYAAFFYNLEYENKALFAVVGAVISVGICFLDFYTRKSVVTCILGMVNMVLLFPTIVMDFGNWPLIIPAAIVTLFGFFCCHMNETAKTVFGTIFLLMYIIGGLAFYFIFNFFEVNTEDTLIDIQSSPSGAFRSYTLDVQNKASGKYVVYIAPNTLDKDYKMFRLNTTIKKMVYQVNKPAEMSCRWDGENFYINDEVFFSESEYSAALGGEVIYDFKNKGNWIYTCFDLDYPLSDTINNIKNKLFRKNQTTEETSETTEESSEETDNSDDSSESSESENTETE